MPIPALDSYLPAPARVRHQPFYRALHRLALRGLGYGNGDPASNGELALVGRLSKAWPERPTILDVGAHTGEWTSAVLAAAPTATIYALEPSPHIYPELLARVGDASRTFQIGLSDEPGEMTLWAPPNAPSWASVYRRDLSSVQMSVEQSATVRLTTLDRFCADHDIGHIHLLKVDVEGHELAVLRGASRHLERQMVDAVQFEFGATQIDARAYLRDFRDVLGPRGYRLHRIVRDGLVPCHGSETEEIFEYSNFVALRN